MLNIEVKKNNETEEIIIENGLIKTVIVPSQGGRIVEFSKDGFNVLYRNKDYIGIAGKPEIEETAENWKNFGGYKGWHAPQSIWCWPPVFEMDMANYSYGIVKSDEEAVVILNAPESDRLNFKAVRTVTIKDNSNELCIKEEFFNTSGKEEYISVWDNTQVVTPGNAEMTLHSDRFLNGVSFFHNFPFPSNDAYELSDKEEDKVLSVKCESKEQFKLGICTDKTEITYTVHAYDKDIKYTKKFDYEGQVVYPHGNNIELYSDSTLPYAELEVLTGMKKFGKGESISLTEVWSLE